MNGSNNTRKAELLAEKYRRNGNAPVAFIDESYQSRQQQESDAPFYIATAVVIHPDDHEVMREQLAEVVSANYWHSTQAFQTEGGRAKFNDLIDYIVEGIEPIIIAVQTQVDPRDTNLEESRLDCMTALACDLTSGTVHEPVRLIVIEERHDNVSRRRDEYIFTQARSHGLIPRATQVFQASPSYERLLWMPDVISYALYRKMVGKEAQLYAPISQRVRSIDVSRGYANGVKKPS